MPTAVLSLTDHQHTCLPAPSDAGSPWRAFATDDPELGHEYLTRTIVDHRQVLRAPDGRFRLRVALAGVGRASLGHVRCSVGAKTFVPPFDSVLVLRLLAGSYRMEAGGLSAALRPGQTAIMPGDATVGERSDIDVQVTVLPMDVVRQAAAEVTGDDGHPRFLSLTPVSAEAEQHWIATVDYVEQQVLANPMAWANPLVQQASQHMLAATALATFPVATSAGAGVTDAVSSPKIRRAADYLEDHADRPVTLGEVADAVDLSPRALQYGFRREFGVTPLGFHRLARLRGAHRQLVAADSDQTTVTEVALAWGFADLSRFAASYRAEFGTTPSATLRTTGRSALRSTP